MNLKEFGNVFTSKSVGTGPSSYEKRIYWAAVSQRLRNTALESAAPFTTFIPSRQSDPSLLAVRDFNNASFFFWTGYREVW